MLAPVHRVHLGLCAAVLLFVACLAILGLRAAKQDGGIGRAPSFALPDSSGHVIHLSDLSGKVVVLAFVDSHCPGSNAYLDRLESLARQSGGQTRVFCVDTADQAHALAARVHWRAAGLDVPLLIDQDGAAARAFGVRQTPTVCIIDGAAQLQYIGPFDDNRNAALVRANFCSDRVNQLLARAP